MAQWDEARVEMLKQLWSDGLSASQIAAKLGGWPATSPDGGRNACIGKLHRLGISGRITVRRAPSKTYAAPKPARVAAFRPPVEQRRASVFDLRDGECKWPVGTPGTPDFFFCGGPQSSGYPYCPFHCRVAFNHVPASRRVFVPQRRFR